MVYFVCVTVCIIQAKFVSCFYVSFVLEISDMFSLDTVLYTLKFANTNLTFPMAYRIWVCPFAGVAATSDQTKEWRNHSYSPDMQGQSAPG